MIRFVNCFEVPQGRDDAFLGLFAKVNSYMAAQPGYLSHRLHRSLSPDARYRYVNYVEWASVEDWARAHGEEFRRMVRTPEWAEFTSTPALYEVVHQGRAAA